MSHHVSDTSLKDTIAEFTANMAKHAPPEVIATLGAEIAKLAESGIAKKALKLGDKAPEFSLPDTHDKAVSLSSLLAKGPAVVTFYRGGWCPFCDLQLRAYQSVLPEIHRLGAELVAISAQTADYALSDVEKKQLTFPVLHDAHNGVSREYGLVFALSDTMKKLQAGFGNPIPKFNGDDSWELAMPGTFVLDRKGSRTSIRTTWCGSSRRPFSMRFGRCLDCPRLGVRVDRDCFWRARELLEAVD